MAKKEIQRVEKPWGYELIWAHTERYVGKILHINAGQKLSRQYHNKKEETFLVQSGEMDLEIGEGDTHRVLRMKALDSFHSRLYSIEAIRRAGDQQLYPFQLRAPGSR